jgi:hypothetical protein
MNKLGEYANNPQLLVPLNTLLRINSWKNKKLYLLLVESKRRPGNCQG